MGLVEVVEAVNEGAEVMVGEMEGVGAREAYSER